MQRPRFTKNLVAEVVREHRGCAQLNFAPQKVSDLELHSGKSQQTWYAAGEELHEYVDVAGGPKAVAAFRCWFVQDTPEERKARHPVTQAEGRDLVIREMDTVDEHVQSDFIMSGGVAIEPEETSPAWAMRLSFS